MHCAVMAALALCLARAHAQHCLALFNESITQENSLRLDKHRRMELWWEGETARAVAALLRAALLAAGVRVPTALALRRAPPGLCAPASASAATLAHQTNESKNTTFHVLAERQLRLQSKPHVALARLVRRRSHLFVVCERWATAPSPQPPPSASLVRGPAGAGSELEAFERFAPRPSDLRELREREAHLTGADALEEAACERTRASRTRDRSRRAAAAQYGNRTKRWIAIFTCNKKNYSESSFFKILEEKIDLSIELKDFTVLLYAYNKDCSNTSTVLDRLEDWNKNGNLPSLIGVVSAVEFATEAAASFTDKYEVPFITYDVLARSGLVRSSAGCLAHLALELRRLLAHCGWKRVAVLSEPTPLANALATALTAPTTMLETCKIEDAGRHVGDEQLTLHHEPLALPVNESYLRHTLEKLQITKNTRVFLVNTNSNIATTLLGAAKELGLTPEAGFAWIVREWDGVADIAAALQPYSVSFAWRGSVGGHAAPGGRAALRDALDALWRPEAWPAHAAPLADAVLMLVEGFASTYNNSRSKRKVVRKFWKDLAEQHTNITGVAQELRYDENRGVTGPLVYVQHWSAGAGSRPRVFTDWSRGDGLCPVPLSDGTAACRVSAGDAFQPLCYDARLSATCALALLALGGGGEAMRRAFAHRKRRTAAKITAEMLLRRDGALAPLATRIVDREALEMGEALGAGRFGRVWRATLRGPGHRRSVVAAKAPRADASIAEEDELLREACVLAVLEHEHVLRFVGVVAAGGPPLLLMECAHYGELLRYLRARRHLVAGPAPPADSLDSEEAAHVSAKALTRFAREAAAALVYLARRGLVHRDVRAANCLVDERRALKLGDFGMARATGGCDGEYVCRRRALFPVLWMAPESVAHGVFTAASDVWALGVLALELVTLGARPWGARPPQGVWQLVCEGARAPLPRDASDETRALALACWRRAAAARPSATTLVEWLTERPRALRPALAPEADAPDGDSGYGDADAPLSLPPPPPSESPPDANYDSH